MSRPLRILVLVGLAAQTSAVDELRKKNTLYRIGLGNIVSHQQALGSRYLEGDPTLGDEAVVTTVTSTKVASCPRT